jgi:hypothetical protein
MLLLQLAYCEPGVVLPRSTEILVSQKIGKAGKVPTLQQVSDGVTMAEGMSVGPSLNVPMLL